MTKNKANTEITSGTILSIPLCKLKKSPRNARKVPHPKADIEALAASIAANGMLQSPVVEPEANPEGKPTGFYLVTIGEGRRLAQLLRAKRKEIAKNEPIRCVVDTAHNAFEISLAENAVRSSMHPADQFDAFFKLHTEHGMAAEDIAARFGVTAAVVRQRLKLAVVSPALIQIYRDGEMNLDQLTAFAITDDHAKQEAVWAELARYTEADREAILDALNEDHVPANDPRAVFVGAQAYEAAGGIIIRDLFSEEGDGYFADPALLDRLVSETLAGLAASVQAEGWKWVHVMPRHDHAFTANMRRIYPEPIALTDEDQANLDALEAEYEAFDPDESEESAKEIDRLESAIAALQGDDVFDPADIARAGVVISIGHDGEPRIERGFIRREDDSRDAAPRKLRAAQEGSAPLSDRLVAELTAHKTVALRHALGGQPRVALTAVIHALAAATFFPHGARGSCLHISGRSAYLGTHAPGIDDCPAAVQIAARHEEWARCMPESADDLWAFVGNLNQEQGLALLAHCASLTVDTVRVPHPRDPVPEEHVAQLAEAVKLDMADTWHPTASSYFGRVSKERILDAVREATTPEAADNIKGLKKPAMAEAAEQRLRDRRWLPPILRTTQPETPAAMAA